MMRLLFVLVWCCWTPAVASWTELLQRGDVIGHYKLSNEEQCKRLCWYRKLCFSFNYLHGVSNPSAEPNCVLHTQAGASNSNATLERGWMERQATSISITNTCRSRPCGPRQLCVPRAILSSTSAGHECLPAPSICGDPKPVANGNISVFGNTQGDVSRVTCDDMFVGSPRNVSMDMRCQVTSEWTPFKGRCVQYEYFLQVSTHITKRLPWKPEAGSRMCLRGIFVGNGQLYINFKPVSSSYSLDAHIFLRTNGVFWTKKENGTFQFQRTLGQMPLNVGDSYNITLRVFTNNLKVVVNVDHTYSIPFDYIQSGVDGIDIRESRFLETGGAVNQTYINLIYGC